MKSGSFEMGVYQKGQPNETSLAKFDETTIGFEKAVGKFLENLCVRCP